MRTGGIGWLGRYGTPSLQSSHIQASQNAGAASYSSCARSQHKSTPHELQIGVTAPGIVDGTLQTPINTAPRSILFPVVRPTDNDVVFISRGLPEHGPLIQETIVQVLNPAITVGNTTGIRPLGNLHNLLDGPGGT